MLVAVGFRNGQNAHNPDVTKNLNKSKMLLAAENKQFLVGTIHSGQFVGLSGWRTASSRMV